MITEQTQELSEKLRQKILTQLPSHARLETAVPGLTLSRYDEPTSAIRCFYQPMIAIVVQGFKHSMIGDYEASYGARQCIIVGVDMPGVFHITDASPQNPFLSLSVKLDRQILSRLIGEMPSILTEGDAACTPVAIAETNRDILDAFLRLVALLDAPERIPVLAPLILQEIHFYLLSSRQGSCLRLFNTGGTQANRISRAISWLREHYAEPFHAEELARQVHMAPSTFNRHFRQVTSLSPLQFQKRLRLYEAERLMLVEGQDAGTAALMVGYESGSQFNREYKRQFGAPPRRDVTKKRS